ALFSYSLTELAELPSWVTQCEGLMIVEPGTQDDGRRLLEIRKKLISQGWFIAAPCTHQKACPLLTHSERDWCHDRCNWNPPEWILAIERYMPIRNGTLPYSYLMARKSVGTLSLQNGARITGDLQEFKGFAKQLVCRGGDREFIAWQRRDFKKEYPNILRGDLIQVDPDVKKKGNELRPELHQLVAGKGCLA
ncbi:MAG: hypothetical protein NTV34_18965, partial [Proteobacteria bacterium]|nr:hypothetical protein [Pseudomonadota bacterium]